MHGADDLACVALTDDWAHRHIELVARDFDALPLTTRLLVPTLSPAPS